MGRPGKPIRLLVGLHYLKNAYDESDESCVEGFLARIIHKHEIIHKVSEPGFVGFIGLP